MATESEKEVKLAQIEKLYLMGFGVNQIALALSISVSSVIRYKKEIYNQIKERYKEKGLLINDILMQYDRLIEEGWKSLEKLDERNKGHMMGVLNKIMTDRTDRLAKLGFIQVEPDRIEIKQDPMSIQNLILLARKIEK